MGLLDRLKRSAQPASSFQFQLEDRFALKGDTGVVITGLLTQGEIRVGDKAACYDAAGRLLFTCRVEAMEQPGGRIQTASAQGPYGAHCALMIRGRTKADFQQVTHLTEA